MDKCLFIQDDCIIVVYVDDCLLFSKLDDVLDKMISYLGQTFKITTTANLETYRGLEVTQNDNGTTTLRQPGLIDKVIRICGLETKSNTHLMPADKILHKNDKINEPRIHTWSYHQVIGILNYKAASTRPDITFAIHQCARFSADPKRHHEIAVQQIVRYLKGSRDKGYILHPTDTPTIDCYTDADFAASWTSETLADPSSAYSRSGYIITFASCPILWTLKIQTETALLTTKAEYISLSQALRDLIPLRTVLQEVSKTFGYEFKKQLLIPPHLKTTKVV